MAVPSTSNIRLKLKKPLEVWSTREKLCLASAVFKIGDQNWVSVSRAIKPYAEPSRPPEWFHQKNCLLQYYDLMEQLEQPKRKRGGDRSESDTPSLQIMRKMTIERSEQLKKEIVEMQQTFKQMKSDVESIKAGLWDDHIEDVWQQIQEEQRNAETKPKIEVKVEDDYDENKTSVAEISDTVASVVDIDDNTQDIVGDISVLTDEDGIQSENSVFHTVAPVVPVISATDIKLQSASHLLQLLKSDVKTATELQQLKHEQEQGQQQDQSQDIQQPLMSHAQRSLLKTPVTLDDPLTTSPSCTAPTLSRLLSTVKSQAEVTSVIKSTSSSDVSLSASADPLLESDAATEDIVEESVIRDNICADTSSSNLPQNSDMLLETLDNSALAPYVEEVELEAGKKKEDVSVKTDEEQRDEEQNITLLDQHAEIINTVKKELDRDSLDEDEDTSIKKSFAESFASEAEATESSVKDEPLSPTSSISSKISDAGSKRGNKTRGRPRNTTKSSGVSTRKSYLTDDDRKDDGGSSRHSDVELSDDDIRESDDILTGQRTSVNVSSILSESFPNSPASLSICSDTEEEKSFKQWKKSIMLVWRAAATHKYANVFLHPVTDEIAPGYRSVVLRPMDLSTIKKNVETGFIRSTLDFQHDMMLMFTNAIMYNSSDHNVFKIAKEMYDDVMQHIEQYVNTQMMIQTSDAKNLRQSRRTDASDKEDDAKKRKLSVDQTEGGGKTKKRKIKVDEILP